ncbi:MAG: hypothetical protein KIT31_01355 [Deltaproteobacteria bacterium]|nr:hypothetical protein [Deltaproteobacteria bacterium]
MKKLAMYGFAALLLSQAAGCIIYDNRGRGGHGPIDGEDALITARWTFKDEATQTLTGCPAGFNTVAVHSFPVDTEGQRIGDDVIDLFDCIDGGGTTGGLYPDVYGTFLRVTNASGSKVYAEGLSATVDIIDRDATVDTTILNDGGYFAMSWDLVGASSNARLQCNQVDGLAGIELISTSVATPDSAISDKFTCGDHVGVTGGLVQGSYTVSIAALGAGDRAVGTAPAVTKTINDRNAVTDLGHILIPIDGK